MALLLRLAGGFGVVLLLLLLLAGLIYYLCLLPPTEPRGIPSIPFWVALLPLVKDVDQQVVFARYIEKPLRTHGAVKIFFASKWNLLLHRPALLADLFKHEDRYQKSGNQKKIPGSVLASFLGDNIISSHGQIWKSYRQIIQPGLQRQFDLDVLLTNADRLCDMLVDSQADKSHNGDGISVQASIQRHTIANFAQVVYEVDLGTLRSKAAYLDHLQRRIKREIFKPIFMNFPFLDRLGFPSRRRARLLAAHFTDQLVEALERAHPTDVKEPRNLPCSLLAARKTGELTEQQFRDNVTVLFVAGQENPQLAILSTMYLLAKHPEIQERLHDEVVAAGSQVPTHDVLQSMPLLTAILLESLRLLPPIGQLLNRRAAEPLILGNGIFVPQGTYLGYNCYSTNRDPLAWGIDADQFRPRRWGSNAADIQREFRRRRARAEFISFHGGRRACLGERFAMLQMKATLFVLAKRLRWKLDSTWEDKMTPAGPLCPRQLRLVIEPRAQGTSEVKCDMPIR